nr:immunoglobulin heavy chain junction region [Mus musculus]
CARRGGWLLFAYW